MYATSIDGWKIRTRQLGRHIVVRGRSIDAAFLFLLTVHEAMQLAQQIEEAVIEAARNIPGETADENLDGPGGDNIRDTEILLD